MFFSLSPCPTIFICVHCLNERSHRTTQRQCWSTNDATHVYVHLTVTGSKNSLTIASTTCSNIAAHCKCQSIHPLRHPGFKWAADRDRVHPEDLCALHLLHHVAVAGPPATSESWKRGGAVSKALHHTRGSAGPDVLPSLEWFPLRVQFWQRSLHTTSYKRSPKAS